MGCIIGYYRTDFSKNLFHRFLSTTKFRQKITFCPTKEIFANFFQKNRIFPKKQNFSKKTEFFQKNRIFSKTKEFFPKKGNVFQKKGIFFKKKGNFCRKKNFLPKIEILLSKKKFPKILDFCIKKRFLLWRDRNSEK